jgi:hypothetical protein
MNKPLVTAIALLSLCLSACSMNSSGAHFTGMSSGDSSGPGTYCYEHKAVCIAAGVVVVGGVTAIIVHNNRDHNNPPPPSPSDARLKRDIHPVTVANGVQLYSFRYAGDDRVFVGALAQDLLKNAAFADAVSVDARGFYAVDYAKLGLEVVNGDAMRSAGAKAERLVAGL